MANISAVALRDAFIKNTKNLVFRRVRHVGAKFDDLSHTVVEEIRGGKPCVAIFAQPEGRPLFTPQQLEQNVQEVYQKFFIFTADAPLRGNDRWGRVAIYGSSQRCSELDFTKDFSFLPAHGCNIPPRIGDLVCGVVQAGRKNPQFKYWFTCSEQFFHAWTSIIYEDHESLTRRGSEEDQIRRYLMSGNRLCTNSYRKWIQACEQNGISVTDEAMNKRYYTLRTESTSRNHVHIYAALVLLLRYHELPNETNIPHNLDKGPKSTKWDLPAGWIETLINMYDITLTAPLETPTNALAITVDNAKIVFLKENDEEPPHAAVVGTTKNLINIEDYDQFPVL